MIICFQASEVGSMSIFRGRRAASTLRFCQSVNELPCFDLFSRHDLTLMISKLSTFSGDPLRDYREARAFGIIVSAWQGGAALPVELEFRFNTNFGDVAGSGNGFVDELLGDNRHFRAQFFLNDPARAIFEKFQNAFEHAAISGNNYKYIVLRKENYHDRYDRRRNMSLQEKRQVDREEFETYQELVKKIKSGEAELPDINFNQVLFEDCITLKAPSWSHSEVGADLSASIYHSRAMAKWRQQRNRS